jgi:hypothetical protein
MRCLDLNRRQFVLACGASLVFPLPAFAAQAVRARFVPEAFGAVGDGVADDYDAFVRLVQAVNNARGGQVALTPGRTYFMNRYVTAANGVANLTFDRCDGLTIEGNGATIAVKGDFHRDRQSTRGLAGLVFEDCKNVTLRNVELIGNVSRTTRLKSLSEAPSHGLIFGGCSDVSIDGITARHFAGDGLYIRHSRLPGPSGARAACRRFNVRNSRFLFNARQGLSVIQLRGGLFDNCDFSYTGYVDRRGTRGSYGSHSPSAGVDVEPNRTPLSAEAMDLLTGDIMFRGCRMVGNGGSAFVACKAARGEHFLELVRLEACHLECNDGRSGGRDGFIFDVPGGSVADCTLQMKDKTAYLGWHSTSKATFQFVRNTVTGRTAKPGHSLLEVRPTLGAPVIEDNRIIAIATQGRSSSAATGSRLFAVRNPNAIVRNNRVSFAS